MATITIELTETQYKGLQYAAASPEDWAENAVTHRARVAIDEIVQMYIQKALDEGVNIPSTRNEIVMDAYERGWIKTAAQRNEESITEAE
jgi:hypothetical protein